MLSLFLVQAFTISALPVTGLDDEATMVPCYGMESYRTILNIVWGCFTTIFLCTWVAIHTNVPGPTDRQNFTRWQRLKCSVRDFILDRMPLFLCSLLIPEYILAWAIRQRLSAERMAKKNSKSWIS